MERYCLQIDKRTLRTLRLLSVLSDEKLKNITAEALKIGIDAIREKKQIPAKFIEA